jgi:ribosome maturation factor RimP
MEAVQTLREKIVATLEEYFSGTPFFVVEVQVTPTQKITVYADGESNITIEKCAEISRFLEHYLESNGLVGEKYLLEVSSPGMDEPLRVPQQFAKTIGREVEVLLKTGIKEIGILQSFNETGITIEIPELKKKKETIPAQIREIPFEDIKHTKKHFVFK